MALDRGYWQTAPNGPPRHFDTPRIPGPPRFIQMVDREDGTVWTLWHRQSDERIGLTDAALPIPCQNDYFFYGPYEGPYLGQARLFVRSGRIGYDLPGDEKNSAPPHSRIKWTRFWLQIQRPSGWLPRDTLGWKVVTP